MGRLRLEMTASNSKLPIAWEASGILNWLLQGCLDWQREGLAPPKAVLDATTQYRTEMDVLGGFLAEECVLGSTLWAKVGDLYARYTGWCDRTGEHAGSQRDLARAMTERGYVSRPQGHDKRSAWLGIGLLVSGPSQPPGGTVDGPPTADDAEAAEASASAFTHDAEGAGGDSRVGDIVRELRGETWNQPPQPPQGVAKSGDEADGHRSISIRRIGLQETVTIVTPATKADEPAGPDRARDDGDDPLPPESHRAAPAMGGPSAPAPDPEDNADAAQVAAAWGVDMESDYPRSAWQPEAEDGASS